MPLLRKFKTAFGTIKITRSGDGSLSYFQNGCFHSQTDKNGVSVCAYIHVIYDVVLQAQAKKILIIGCGGGSLATMLRRKKCKVTVVDINPNAFEIAKDYFKLPKDIVCIVRDGVEYLETVENLYDAIVIDVFGSNNAIPACFTTKKLFASIKRAMAPKGMVMMNVITRDDRDHRAERIASNAGVIGRRLRLFDWPGEFDRNSLILIGGPNTLCVPTGKEPKDIQEDMNGMVCRALRQRGAKIFSPSKQ